MREERIARAESEQLGGAPGRTVLDLEAAGFRHILLVGRYSYVRAQPPLEQHSHGNVFEVCLLARGEQMYVAGGKEYLVHGGDLFVTKTREPHGTGRTPEKPGVLYWIQFRHPGERGHLLGLSARETRVLIEGYCALGRHVYHGGGQLVPLWNRILSTYATADTPLAQASLRNLLLRLLLDILDVTRKHESPMSLTILDTLNYIEGHVTERLPIEELALRVNLSPSHFKARFKNEVGIPPAEYISRRRVETAKEQLGHASRSVTDIALGLGYSSSQHFATAFKRFAGMTPRQFRKGAYPGNLAHGTATGAGVSFHPTAAAF